MAMIIDQVGDRLAAMFLAEVKLAARILLDVIVFDVWLRNFGVERECVETFCWWLANDEAAFFIILFQERFGTLAGHVTDVPAARNESN